MEAGPRIRDHIHGVDADPGIGDCHRGVDTGVGWGSCAGELWVTALLVAGECLSVLCLSVCPHASDTPAHHSRLNLLRERLQPYWAGFAGSSRHPLCSSLISTWVPGPSSCGAGSSPLLTCA